ncbi:Uncharacterized protein C10orf107-like [Stylophora pistillata]|uniref:Uncharacterized protein C10orf107-like n=1 Tax=Stylophora pistillata TaxID=50429 RepID=A0A2B4RN97_STYPI|nr:Uncharacterized protein C10orf107-like [Stylophora pistillata]
MILCRFAKEQNFTLQQISAFFTLLKEMLDNVKEKQFSLVDSIQKFKSLLAGIGVENCALNGGLECFDVNLAKLITDYFTDSLFQHYKLYQFLFTREPQEVVISEGEIDLAGEEALSDNLSHIKDQAAENILSSLEPAQVKDIVRKVADKVLGNLQAEVEARLKERETVLAAKIGKLQPR